MSPVRRAPLPKPEAASGPQAVTKKALTAAGMLE